MILATDENGVPVNIMVDAPVATVIVDYDFELRSMTAATPTQSNGEQYIQSFLPEIENRLGEAVATFMKFNTEKGEDEEECGGYFVDEWRLRRRKLREDSNQDLTKIIGIASTDDSYSIDLNQLCDPPSDDCYVVNGHLEATYVGTNEASVKSAVSRLVKNEMESSASGGSSSSTELGSTDTAPQYEMKYLGPHNGGETVQKQAPSTPSAIIQLGDITDALPDVSEFNPTPMGIGILAVLAATFAMAMYALFIKNGKEIKEEISEEIVDICDKVAKKGGKERSKKGVPLGDDEEASFGYDLEAVATNAKGEDADGEVEVESVCSFGHTNAVNLMKRDASNGKKAAMAAAATAVAVGSLAQAESQCSSKKKRSSSKIVSSSFSRKAANEIPANFRMISGCADAQTSADANITAFQLPDPAGRQGGACTAALLQVLYKGNKSSSSGKTWADVMNEMRQNLSSKGYDQIPQLSSSRAIDMNDPFTVAENPSGTKRAVLIGINYVGQSGELSGCHNDVKNISQYLIKAHGFQKKNMATLMDDGRNEEPTYANIMLAFERVARDSQPGDTVWVHYSGHGGRLRDDSNDESDGYDETLIPADFKRRGQIRDDDVLKYLVKPMKQGVTVTVVCDSCHSGTVLDLPYQFIADGKHDEMERNAMFLLGKRRKSWKKVTRASGPSASVTSQAILNDLETPDARTYSVNDPYPMTRLPSVPEVDLSPPTNDTPHKSYSMLVSPSPTNMLKRFASVEVVHNEKGNVVEVDEDEEQWEV
jgi:hypothetical protein